jgi:hypothetical protein
MFAGESPTGSVNMNLLFVSPISTFGEHPGSQGMLQTMHMHKGALGTKIAHGDNESARLIDHVMVLATSGELSMREYMRTRKDILKNMELAQNASELLVQNTIELTDTLTARRQQKFDVMEKTMAMVQERQKQQQKPSWKDVVSPKERQFCDMEDAVQAELVHLAEEDDETPHNSRNAFNWHKKKKKCDPRRKLRLLPKPKKL